MSWEEFNSLAPAARTGDPVALSRLMRLAYPLARGVIRTCGFRPPRGFDQVDLVQAGVIGILKGLQDWDPARQPDYSILAHLAAKRDMIEVLQYGSRVCRRPQQNAVSLNAPAVLDDSGQPEDESRLDRWLLPDPSGFSRNPADVACDHEGEMTAAQLLQFLAADLSDAECTVLDWFLLWGEPAAETAARLGRSTKAVDNLARHAIDKMTRKALALSTDVQFSQDVRQLLREFAEERCKGIRTRPKGKRGTSRGWDGPGAARCAEG